MLVGALERLDICDCGDSGDELSGCCASLGDAMEGQWVGEGDSGLCRVVSIA